MPESPAPSGLDALAAVIDTLKQRIARDGATIETDETRTRMALVDPLLNALGWDTTDPAMVIPEHHVGSDAEKADYVLRKTLKQDGSPIIAFIGTKRLNEPLENHRAQMLTYANMAGAGYACLTNGDCWEVYEVFKGTPGHGRPLLEISIRRETAVDCAVKLQLFKLPALEAGLALSPRAARQLLSEAAEAGASTASIRQLLDQDESLLTWVEYGKTPLHSAAMYILDPAEAARLLDLGADVEAVTTAEITTASGSLLASGQTPLHIAAGYNEEPTMSALLLDRGADITATNNFGQTPLHLAAKHNINPAVAALLIDRGADITTTDNFGEIPLHLAVEHSENPAVIALLLDHYADIAAADLCGQTPLHLAAENNAEPAVIELLLDQGGNIEARDNCGRMPVHFAATSNENPEVIELLLSRGALIEVRNNSGETPLHCAVKHDNTDAIEYLFKGGADIGARVSDMFGWTALHLAIECASKGSRDSEVIEELLRRGADLNVLTYDGKTPYQIAEECGADEKVLQLLRG